MCRILCPCSAQSRPHIHVTQGDDHVERERCRLVRNSDERLDRAQHFYELVLGVSLRREKMGGATLPCSRTAENQTRAARSASARTANIRCRAALCISMSTTCNRFSSVSAQIAAIQSYALRTARRNRLLRPVHRQRRQSRRPVSPICTVVAIPASACRRQAGSRCP